jgi:NAD(P) transhydrogenase subunit alpha
VIVGVLKETLNGERRVALVPAQVALLAKQKHEIVLEQNAGEASGYPDAEYTEAGARIVSRDDVFAQAKIIIAVRGTSLVTEADGADLARLKADHVVVALFEPLAQPKHVEKVGATGALVYAMELIPRITRAQSMDALSSMANLAGYKSVLLAASHAPRIFPMMTTAAGTLTAAKVLVLGAGVAGLQAIATAKRLGAAVQGYDIRPEVAEQIKSVGGKFVDLGLSAESDKGGYAKAQSAEFIARQQEALAQFVRAADVVITTAQVPGRRAPVLVTAAMQKGMRPGSVVVDLAAESGGNCELTKPGTHVVDGVTMIGPVNFVSELAFHASQLYGRNVVNLLLHLTTKEGELAAKDDDEIVRETRVASGGSVTHERVKQALAPA